MSVTLYVGNLPWGTTEEELAQVVGPYAEVKGCRIITDRETGRSRGFGFVEVAPEGAQRAIENLNGSTLGGRTLTVAESQPRPH